MVLFAEDKRRSYHVFGLWKHAWQERTRLNLYLIGEERGDGLFLIRKSADGPVSCEIWSLITLFVFLVRSLLL